MTSVSMTVNGKTVSGDVEGRTLLSHFLREGLNLTGTHIGCDTGQCGACTVHVNGVAVKSCNMFAQEAEGADVKTIEGMANEDGSLGVIQAAFQEHHGLQCGFCTPGMVMAASDLLAANSNPSEAEIRKSRAVKSSSSPDFPPGKTPCRKCPLVGVTCLRER